MATYHEAWNGNGLTSHVGTYNHPVALEGGQIAMEGATIVNHYTTNINVGTVDAGRVLEVAAELIRGGDYPSTWTPLEAVINAGRMLGQPAELTGRALRELSTGIGVPVDQLHGLPAARILELPPAANAATVRAGDALPSQSASPAAPDKAAEPVDTRLSRLEEAMVTMMATLQGLGLALGQQTGAITPAEAAAGYAQIDAVDAAMAARPSIFGGAR